MRYNILIPMDRHKHPHETGTARLSILDSAALLTRIYGTHALPQDRQFLDVKEGGAFQYFNLQDLLGLQRTKRLYPLLEISGVPVGLAELEENPYQPKTFWIKFISIDVRHRGRGYASKIAERLFRLAKQEGYTLETSSYSETGYEQLKPLFNRLAKEYDIPFIDTEGRI